MEQDEFPAEDQPMVGASLKSWGGGSRLPCLLAYFHPYRALQHPHVCPQSAEVAFRITLVASNSAVQVFFELSAAWQSSPMASAKPHQIWPWV